MRWLLAVVLAALVVTACGDDDDDDVIGDGDTPPTTEPTDTTTTSPGDEPPAEPAAGSVELRADPPRRVPAGPVTWTVEVVNVTDDAVVLTYPSSQQADAIIRTDDGTVVHRWSDGMFFTQQIVEETLEAGETTTIQLEDDLSGVEPGSYELVLELTVVGPPDPVVQNIRIVAP